MSAAGGCRVQANEDLEDVENGENYLGGEIARVHMEER